jgi:hypothetical protein
MPVIVIGGSGRGVGKTALVCELIAAFPTIRWTAVKITSHHHGNLEPVCEEHEPGQGTDTARYLAAGAARALLVTASDAGIPLGALHGALGSDANVLFESNRILEVLKPDLSVGVLGGPQIAIKPSFRSFVAAADGLIALESLNPGDLRLQNSLPVFRWEVDYRIDRKLFDWTRAKLFPEGRITVDAEG